MKKRKTNPDFLTGVPELLVLRLVSRQPMHGYAVVQAIKVHTDGQLSFGEGSIYPVLHRLESEAYLESTKVAFRGRERVVYAITAKGKRLLDESQSNWHAVVDAVSKILSGGDDEQQAVA